MNILYMTSRPPAGSKSDKTLILMDPGVPCAASRSRRLFPRSGIRFQEHGGGIARYPCAIMAASVRTLALVLAITAAPACAQDTPRARNIAANCAACHGTNGASSPAMPRLAGMSKAELVRKMQDFKAGRVPSTIMGQLARGYSDEQIELAASHFAAQSP